MSSKVGLGLRAAKTSEAEALYKMRAQSFEALYKSSTSPDVLNALMWGYSPSEFALAVDNKEMWVAEIQGDIAGFVWIDATHGKELVVNPDHYGSGVARALLVRAIRILLERNTGEIEIYATPQTAKWYKRFAFKPVTSMTVRHSELGVLIPLEKMILKRDDAVVLTARALERSPKPIERQLPKRL